MVAVKVDFHLRPPKLLGPRSNQSVIRKRIPGLSSSVHGFHGTGSIPILSFTALSQTLLTAKILFSGLHGHMAQQEPNLFEFASCCVTQTGTGSSEVMRRELQDSTCPAYCLRHATPLFLSFHRPRFYRCDRRSEIVFHERCWRPAANRQPFA